MEDSEEHRSLLRDETMRAQKLSTVDIRMPANWVGSSLQGAAKEQFQSLRRKIDLYNLETVTTENLVRILDAIEEVKSCGNDRAVIVLSEIVNYLRTLLLSRDTEVVFHTVILLDCIVKNSGFIMHILIGRRKFMKTLSLIARRHLNEPSQTHKRVGVFALDCLQAWGEAFYPRQEFYPHIYGTYLKLRTKYKVKFPRPDFDPTRVPIFLGVVSATERVIANKFNNEVRVQYGSVTGKEDSKDEDAEIAEAIAQSLADTTTPQDTIDYEPMRRFNEGTGRLKSGGESEGTYRSHRDESVRDDDLEAAIRASLLETDLIDFGSSADSVQSSLPDSVWPENMTLFDGWGVSTSGQKAPTQTTPSAPSSTDHILSLYSSPPARPPAPGVFPFASAPPLPMFPPQVQFTPQRTTLSATWPPPASASTTPAAKWSPPVNPFDVYDLPTPPREPARTNPKPAGTGQGRWELDSVWDLEQLAATIPNAKPKAQSPEPVPPPRPDKLLKPFSASVSPPASPEKGAPASCQQDVAEESPESVPSYPPPPPPPPPPFPTWTLEADVPRGSTKSELTDITALPAPMEQAPPPPRPPFAPEVAAGEFFGESAVHSLFAPPSRPPPPPPLPPMPPPPPPAVEDQVADDMLWEDSDAPARPVLMCDTTPAQPPAPPAFPPPTVPPPPPPPVQSPTFPPEWSIPDSSDMSDYVFDFEPAPAATSAPDTAPAGGVPKLPPPPPGPVRTSWKATMPATLAGPELAEAIQRTKAGLTHVEQHSRAQLNPTASDAEHEDILNFASSRPAPAPAPLPMVPDPKPRPPPRKVGFIQPSADPDVEIRHYGTQRIIVRRPNASRK
jgi:hypothetical protein